MKVFTRRRVVIGTAIVLGVSPLLIGTADAVGVTGKRPHVCLLKKPNPVAVDKAAPESAVVSESSSLKKLRPCKPPWRGPIVRPTVPGTVVCQAIGCTDPQPMPLPKPLPEPLPGGPIVRPTVPSPTTIVCIKAPCFPIVIDPAPGPDMTIEPPSMRL